ncbi:MAG: DUF481 domain-containing protein [Bacteroidota bacterium]
MFFVLLLYGSGNLYAVSDSLVFKNGEVMTGSVKTLQYSVLTFSAPYSKSNFKIKWKQVSKIYTYGLFLITLSEGERYNGNLISMGPDTVLVVTSGGSVVAAIKEVVYLQSVDLELSNRFYASIDLGLSIARANHLKQLSIRAATGYLAKRWSVDVKFSNLFSQQTDVDPTRRTNASVGYNLFLARDWYIPASLGFLSNTEQKLDLRTNGQLGLGKYLIHTNRAYWGFSAGASYNNEMFSGETDDRSTWEGFAGTELNLYDIGDLNLLAKVTIYPGLTDPDRLRSDMNLDVKYNLPLNLYLRAGFTLNYDNRPAQNAPKTDYILQTGLGWAW